MTPEEMQKFLKTSNLKELCESVIWTSVMEGTAHCGWTDNARNGLVKSVQESVAWAIDTRFEMTRELKKIHHDSTTPMDEYHTGLYNGIEAVLCILGHREPAYKNVEKPKSEQPNLNTHPVSEEESW